MVLFDVHVHANRSMWYLFVIRWLFIWFGHTYPPERGYGYVAASRFKSKAGIYLFGKVRRTDWLPVRETKQVMEQDQVDRSE